MNLHLMSVYSHFNTDMIQALNDEFPKDLNLFVLRDPFPGMNQIGNCISDPSRFSISYLNAHAAEFQRIFLHYNFFKPHEIMRLTDEAAEKIVWVVWGDDLYYVKRKYEPPRSLWDLFRQASYIWSHYSLLYGIVRQKAKRKIRKFHAIGIGYSYDEVMIRKLYGEKVSVVFLPVFSNNSLDYSYEELRQNHLEYKSPAVNVLVGHSGFHFHNHEKSLRILSKFKDENIHINMVLSYGASQRRVKKLTKLAKRIYGEDKVTILTETLPYADYCKFLASMDIALFTFCHQSALGNTKRLAYAGVKLYLDPDGALAQGFLEGGVKTFDYRGIKHEPWAEFRACPEPPDPEAPLFRSLDYHTCVAAWKKLLE